MDTFDTGPISPTHKFLVCGWDAGHAHSCSSKTCSLHSTTQIVKPLPWRTSSSARSPWTTSRNQDRDWRPMTTVWHLLACAILRISPAASRRATETERISSRAGTGAICHREGEAAGPPPGSGDPPGGSPAPRWSRPPQIHVKGSAASAASSQAAIYRCAISFSAPAGCPRRAPHPPWRRGGS